MDLDDWLARNPAKVRRQGFPGVMDRISPEHRAQAIDGYRKGIPAKRIREWLNMEYPEVGFTLTNCDNWLYRTAPRDSVDG